MDNMFEGLEKLGLGGLKDMEIYETGNRNLMAKNHKSIELR